MRLTTGLLTYRMTSFWSGETHGFGFKSRRPHFSFFEGITVIGKLLDTRVVVENTRAISKLTNKSYGTVENGKLYLDLIEAAYLVDRGTLELEDKKDILAAAREERSFDIKFLVYKDLRERGLIVKAGFKYGAHFRAYRGSVEDHAEYLIHAVDEKERVESHEFVRTVRMAHTVNKKMVLAFVDMENDITYIEVTRVKM